MPRSRAPSETMALAPSALAGAPRSDDLGATEDAGSRRVIAGAAPRSAAGRGTLERAPAAALVTAQREPVRVERLLDLLDRLLAEVRDRGQLALGLDDQVADRLDPDPLEAVVRADAELELRRSEERRVGKEC